MRTNVYIDGFNLYYRAVKGTPYKWLDLGKVCHQLVPDHDVHRIRYFTALVQGAQAQRRQLIYIRALETIQGLSVHYGLFKRRRKTGALDVPIPGAPPIVSMWTYEEKGSDVNLATLLLSDGYHGEYDQAVVVSNDSDLALPIKTVREELSLRIRSCKP